MVLSRFWLAIFISSLLFVLVSLFTGSFYSLEYSLTGKKDDLKIISEKYLSELPVALQDSLKASPAHSVVINDTSFVYEKSVVKIYHGKQQADGLLTTCKNTITDIIIPLIAYLAFFCGLLQLLIDSGASEKLAVLISPVFVKIFPEIPKNHPSISYMTLNFAANFLGLDSAATPFGLKAMESLQELNKNKEVASNSQIMFMCLHAAGLTLIPTSIIGYRAAQNATNPADVMLPCIITSFIGTIAALLIVGIRQKINFKSASLILSIGLLSGVIISLLLFINTLDLISKNHFTANLSNVLMFGIILFILVYALAKEKVFDAQGKNVFSSFVEGATSGARTGFTVFPYVLGMLVAISLFRNSGLFEIITTKLASFFLLFDLNKSIVDALPVALLRPFSSGGSRGFMIDAMNTYGPDSLTGRLSCIFQCAAETTFYVIAVYFGSINIKNVRYTLTTMLWVDFICVLAAIFVSVLFFGLS
ncbi:nucleoside recognition domain-containing protein [Cytophaga hutchinsonii]|uniref:Spore maturation-related protein n=1 Tax=Cytophaga hutchinsonii (strain ATCC 33406 / DSM 1761 / CIP 103989 / NBRC 15051 / NCIMB 9469 / D465) TaxID=269798 RepID=A0A6N4SSK1_CYTH3|nr:nucleoside recognition domain-containing protein [Cytophaga hutchinsonii]ABG59428.1 spore maturation-related protein [Cytophaga hutchinsonii ATCC 33406]SFY02258.1 Spore maturation protein SpmA [Cytophaga hutchinsonii ATCC 33406]